MGDFITAATRPAAADDTWFSVCPASVMLHPRLSGGAKTLAWYMYARAHDRGMVFTVRRNELASATGLGLRTIDRAVVDLVAEGILRPTLTNGRKLGTYQLVNPTIESKAQRAKMAGVKVAEKSATLAPAIKGKTRVSLYGAAQPEESAATQAEMDARFPEIRSALGITG